MTTLKKRSIALIPLVAFGLANAGQPLQDVLKLRTIQVVRCEVVTEQNVADVSSFVRRVSSSNDGIPPVELQVVESVPGILVEAFITRQRDVVSPIRGSKEPIKSGQWTDADSSVPLNFFAATEDPDPCGLFLEGTRVNVVLSQRAECDTYPPVGICAFDRPITVVSAETWMKFGE